MEPDSVLMPKIDFLATIAGGVQTGMETLGKGLKEYIKAYPKAEPTPLAREILTLIEDSTLSDYQKLVDMGYLHEEIKNDELQPGNQPGEDEFGGKFSYDEDLLHYFVIAYPRSSKVDVNRLKFDIANYNLDHYTKLDFDIEEETLDAASNLLLVRSLVNKEQAMIYFRAIIRQPEVFKALNNSGYYNFIASSANYRQILSEKSLGDYLKFFLKNYSRIIGPDFNPEGAPDESPEELMARAQREDELLRERGKFVTVDVPVDQGVYSSAIDTTQCFVVAVKDKNMALRPMLTQFSDFNRDNFRVWNLALQLKQAGDYQFMVVRGLPGFTESLSYFRKVVLERSLFRSLGQTTYRNFVITDRNLNKLLENGDVDSYLDFFRTRYIQGAGQPQQAPSRETSPAETTKPAAPATRTVTLEYTGPYDLSVRTPHYYCIIVPLEGFRKENLLTAIREFNQSEFPALGLTLEEEPLDAFRSILRITGLPSDSIAMDYGRKITARRTLFASLGNLSYRHFVITPRNYEIFLRRKNITEYLDFIKWGYPGNPQP